jgi:cellulase
MHFSTFLQVLGFLGLMSSTNAHHMLTNIIIGGVDQGDGNSMRIPPNTDPVVNVQSTDMTCNVGGLKSVRKAVSIDAGRSVTLQWRTWPDGSQNAPIADSHQGLYIFPISQSFFSNFLY